MSLRVPNLFEGAANLSIMAEAEASTKFALVQAIRGFAAMWVVLYHAAEGKHLESVRAATPTWLFTALFDAGHFGVSIFFALSGFVIAHSLRNADATPGYVGKFVLRRSIRIDPPYWATIALVIVQQLVAHFFYAQDLTGFTQISGVFWTLCFEIQFYFGFILLLMVQRMVGSRAGWIVRAVMFGAALAGALELFQGLPGGFALIMWHTFFVGVAAYWAGQGSRVWLAALAVLVLVIFAGGSTGDTISAVTAVVLYLTLRTGRIISMMSGRSLQWLGLVSYSLYLTHNIFTGLSFWALRKFMSPNFVSELVQLVLVTAICLFGAYAFWWLAERPAHDFAKRVGASGRTSKKPVGPQALGRSSSPN
jgi:peptidoglycan/LPS O-acetylase OafA/YrhL